MKILIKGAGDLAAEIQYVASLWISDLDDGD